MCIHSVSKTFHLRLAIVLTYTIRLRHFGQKCYLGSKKSDDALLCHLTYLVLLHYCAKLEAQRTEHWCIVRATQSNCCSAIDFLSPESCPQYSPGGLPKARRLRRRRRGGRQLTSDVSDCGRDCIVCLQYARVQYRSIDKLLH